MASSGVSLDVAAIVAGAGRRPPPAHVTRLARLCLLDWLGVAVAGSSEPLAAILREELAGGAGATLIGRGGSATPLDACVINGAASHAMDYDDFHLAIIGHPSVALYPALVALAETRGSSLGSVLNAYVAGYEAACRLGLAIAPSHYGMGFHATGTVGALGAAAACARLLGLDAGGTAMAMGIAATQAAGLKSMFGTMCKPLHAGKAAANGLFAARLAARGFTARHDFFECAQGFAETHARDFEPSRALQEPAGGFYMLGNVFKYHASCGATHSAIEAAREIRETAAVPPESIRAVRLLVDPKCDRICNLPAPSTGLEAKFSLAQTVALTLMGHDTGDPASFTDALATDPGIVAMRERVAVGFWEGGGDGTLLELRSEVEVETTEGRKIHRVHDTSVNDGDLDAVEARLRRKFLYLTQPSMGQERSAAAVERVLGAPAASPLAALIDLFRLDGGRG